MTVPELPSVLFYGDAHGDFAPLRQAVAESPPGVVVLLGDLDLEMPLAQEMRDLTDRGIRVLWVHGNHDMQARRWHDNLMAGGLEEGALHGRVVEIGGIRFAGLGGIFMSRVWRPAPGEMRPPPPGEAPPAADPHDMPLLLQGAIRPADYVGATRLRADVLVCHEAPSSHRKGFAAIDGLGAAMGARLVVHGHHHESYDALLPNGIRAIGVADRTARAVEDLAALIRPGNPPGRAPARASA